MKKTLLLSILMLITSISFSQFPGYNTIDANNIKTGMHSNGNLFFSENQQFANFVVPYEPGLPEVSTIFASGLWVSGVDVNGNIREAHITYGSLNSGQFAAGPLDGNSNNVDFNKVWKVSKEEITAVILDFIDGTIDDTPSDNVMQWPGKGNPHYNGELSNDQQFAPFKDVDGDAIYDPLKGDHPIIGEDLIDLVPEQLLYTVYNGTHQSLLSPIDLEVHTLMYAFDCNDETVLQNTIFTRHTIVSGDEYHNFRVGLWMDADLGCYTDDFLGCDTLLNAFYAYNEDMIDGTSGVNCQGGVNSYGENPPVQSSKFLNQKMESFSIINNGAVGIPPPGSTTPAIPLEFDHFLNGRWRDGSPMTVGGTGYNPSSTDYTKYLYPDDPSDPSGWSMYTANLPFGDRRSLSSTGSETLESGQIFQLDLAHNFTQNSNLDNVETVSEAKVNLQVLQNIYDSKFDGTCAEFSSIMDTEGNDVKIYPNPSTDVLFVHQSDIFDHYLIFDQLGKLVKQGTLQSGQTEIITSSLNGLYILQLENRNTGLNLIKKVIIM